MECMLSPMLSKGKPGELQHISSIKCSIYEYERHDVKGQGSESQGSVYPILASSTIKGDAEILL